MEKPESVKSAALLWSLAVAAGVAESMLAVADIARESGLDSGVWMNVGVRSIIYIGAFVLIAHFSRGRRWARASLAVLLSVVGMAAMVVPAATGLADGESFTLAVGGDGQLATVFVAVRLVHIASVLLATVLMFSPSANRYFAESGARAAVA